MAADLLHARRLHVRRRRPRLLHEGRRGWEAGGLLHELHDLPELVAADAVLRGEAPRDLLRVLAAAPGDREPPAVRDLPSTRSREGPARRTPLPEVANDQKTGTISFLVITGLECVARSH